MPTNSIASFIENVLKKTVETLTADDLTAIENWISRLQLTQDAADEIKKEAGILGLNIKINPIIIPQLGSEKIHSIRDRFTGKNPSDDKNHKNDPI